MFSYDNFVLTEIGLTYKSTNQNHFRSWSCSIKRTTMFVKPRATAWPIAIPLPCYQVLEIVNITLLKTEGKQIHEYPMERANMR